MSFSVLSIEINRLDFGPIHFYVCWLVIFILKETTHNRRISNLTVVLHNMQNIMHSIVLVQTSGDTAFCEANCGWHRLSSSQEDFLKYFISFPYSCFIILSSQYSWLAQSTKECIWTIAFNQYKFWKTRKLIIIRLLTRHLSLWKSVILILY